MKYQNLPYSENCFVCGKDNPSGFQIKFQAKENQVIGEFTATEQHQGYKGVVHGGILCTLLDEAMGWVPTLVTKRMTLSAELNFRFLKPVPIKKKLIISTKVDSIHRRLYTASGQIADEEGVIYVTGSGKFIPLSQKETREVNSWLLDDENTLRVFEPR